MRPCNKASYETRREAQAQARWFRRIDGKAQRAYYCLQCGLWHLTSMSKRQSRQAKKAMRGR